VLLPRVWGRQEGIKGATCRRHPCRQGKGCQGATRQRISMRMQGFLMA
jgi:hypothetical protein